MSDSVRKSLLAAGLVLLLAGGAVDSSRAAVAGMATLSGHASIVAQLQPLGQLPAETNLNLAIGLPLRNREALTNLLQQIYDPASTNYHRYLTTAEFAAQFGPSAQDYQAVINFAQQNGLTVAGTHPNRVLVDVTGTAANIQQAFHVTLRTYYDAAAARSFFAPDVDPTVAATLPILNVSGLDNYFIPQPNLKPMASTGNIPNAGSGPFGSYQGNDFRKAYVPGTTLNGAGQNVGLLQFDGFYPSDIAAYANQIGLTTNVPNLVVVPINGGVPVPTPFGNPEVSLDIEMILSMSPGVSNIYVYEAPNPSPWVDLLSRMANDNLAKQLSCSWGGGPPDAVAEQIFQQMALQGQTFFNAAGDSDAFIGPISFPADSPHITEVGATTLTTGAGAVYYASETVWNWGNEYGPAYDGIGSSGGISTFYSIPSWQTNINFTASRGSATKRNVPDVALTGDNVWVIFGSGQGGAFGGTSCAAPLWAGFTALINQQGTLNGHPPVGFINPAIYAIAAGPSYNNCFHDTRTGDNKWSGSPNLFSAVTNYDLCTGLGSPAGTNLINALTAAGVTNPVIRLSPPPPPYGSTLSVLNGGNPNGNWTLFIQDDRQLDSGSISNGWILNLTTANPVGYSANLTLSMSVSTNTVVAGGYLVYNLGVTNYGPSISSNCIVVDTLPAGFTLTATNSSPGTSVTRSGSLVTWNVGTLAVGGGAQLVLTVQANVAGVNLQNSAIASATTPDPNPGDNSTSVSVNVAMLTPPQLSGGAVGAGGVFSMNITGSPVPTIIQATTNLVAPVWISLVTNTPPFPFTDSNATNYPYRFYRAVTAP